MNFRPKKKRDEQKLVSIYQKYNKKMYGWAWRVLKNDADTQDAVQNALIRIAESLSCLPEDEEKLAAYIYVTVENAAIDLYRKNGRDNKLQEKMSEEIAVIGGRPSGNPEDYIVAMENADEILECLRAINKDYCNIIMLYYYQGFSLKEIAQLYRITEKAAATKLYRARAAAEREMRRVAKREKEREAREKHA